MGESSADTSERYERYRAINITLNERAQKALYVWLWKPLMDNIRFETEGYYNRENLPRPVTPEEISREEARQNILRGDDEVRKVATKIAANLGTYALAEDKAFECGLVDLVPTKRLEAIANGHDEMYKNRDEYYKKLAVYLLHKKQHKAPTA